MSVRVIEGRSIEPLRVLIAGGGVAAIEALLALRKLAAERVEIELLAPESEFVYRPLSVAEPFARGEPRRFSLAAIAADQGARHRQDALAAVDPGARVVQTEGGAELPYDALLLAIGVRRIAAVPGALTFRGPEDTKAFRGLLSELENGKIPRVAFTVPAEVWWPFPLYELALLTAAHLSSRAAAEAQLEVVTHEPRPLDLFGRRASDRVRTLLEEAGIRLHRSTLPDRAEEGRLMLVGRGPLAADRVVSLPGLEVPEIAGVPQWRRGFIPTDAEGRVDGTPRVYAAGDATWFPVKQGGLAAQQADGAAAAIAALAGADVDPQPFRPVLRAALLTGSAPEYLRAELGERQRSSAAAPEALWWPPSKIAGRFLAPYLMRQGAGDERLLPLEDLEAPDVDDAARAASHNTEAIELALAAADADALRRDYRAALRWLELAEQLNLTLPPAYAGKRRKWAGALAELR